MAGNQLGKTLACSAELAMHATGLYPDWWQGRRFDHALRIWAASTSGEVFRDTVQRYLLGPVGDIGSGMIPGRCIEDMKRARGISEAYDLVVVKHVSGGRTLLKMKTYKQKRADWQSDTVDVLWCDEEPPAELYDEGLTRTNNGDNGQGGMVFVSATPLLGITEVVDRFYPVPKGERSLTQMEIWDVDHYTEAQKQAIVDAYPEHEREARARGIPVLGSGMVFPGVHAKVRTEHRDPYPDEALVIGADFGWDHPAGFVLCGIHQGVFTVLREYRARKQTPAQHAQALQLWPHAPVAWPHDGQSHEKSSGQQLASIYRGQGIAMMATHATHPYGGVGTETAITEIYGEMKKGMVQAVSSCTKWWDEFNQYHRKKGKIVKRKDDLMSAMLKAWMMRRYAAVPRSPLTMNRPDPYDSPEDTRRALGSGGRRVMTGLDIMRETEALKRRRPAGDSGSAAPDWFKRSW